MSNSIIITLNRGIYLANSVVDRFTFLSLSNRVDFNVPMKDKTITNNQRWDGYCWYSNFLLIHFFVLPIMVISHPVDLLQCFYHLKCTHSFAVYIIIYSFMYSLAEY